jgi:phage host-nuclease inhibitor protein Gam
MKIRVKLRDIEIEMNDENTESFNRYDTRVDHVIKIIKSITEEVLKLSKEETK